jgi:hypothetical protein
MEDTDNLKLIYVLKVGRNTSGENIFEFIFSKDETNIDANEWGWLESPACDNATPPSKDYIDKICTIKTKEFDLFCLHEAVDREYMHGYHTIHALAYEYFNEGDDSDDNEESAVLVFHYGMSFKTVEELLSNRDIRLK